LRFADSRPPRALIGCRQQSEPYCLRSPEQIARRFFDGLDLVEPGVVSVIRWRPPPSSFGGPAEVDVFGGMGRKP